MHTELIKHQIEAYQEREAAQRGEALAQAAAGNYSTSTQYLRAADWLALKITELQRRLNNA